MQTIDINRQRDRERFEANRRFEEMTDIAERLSYPIDTTIDYELRGDALYALSDTVDRPFREQTFQALIAGERQFTGDQSFQRERLRLEHEEALLVDRFACGDVAGNVLIKYSKVPDAVVEGKTSINGYRRDLLRSFVRMYYRTDTGVSCRLFTLDHNHQRGSQRVGELLDIDTMRPSEEVLADHTVLEAPGDPEYFVEQLMSRVIELYDGAIAADTEVRTYAGSRYLDKRDAMSAIASQPRLISQHMDVIASIVSKAVFICHADGYDQAADLYRHGATYVMLPHFLGSEKIGSFIRQHGFNHEAFEAYRKQHVISLGKSAIKR